MKVVSITDSRAGGQWVYSLDESFEFEGTKTSHVLASRVCVWGEWELYLFACDEDGEVLNWTEMPGSTKGYGDPDVCVDRFIAWVSEGQEDF